MSSTLQTLGKVVGGVVGAAVLCSGGAFLWATSASSTRTARTFETHRVDLPVPFPLTDAARASLRAERATGALAEPAAPADPATLPGDPAAAPVLPLAEVDLDALALEGAVARGKHLVEARYACIECHGANFGGGTMIDAPPIGKILGPNLTTGQGSVVGAYAVADWDRIVRHGVKPDGTPAVMPSEDYFAMSDRELSDIIAYIRSMPPVDAVVPPPTFGPVGTLLLATGELRLSAEQLGDHQAAHAAEPPVEGPTAAFGAHLAAVCTGCHGATLAGGKIPGGDPAWGPAANLTPHADGLAGWTYEDFERALTEGKSRDGRELLAPMTQITPYGRNMTVVERQALWAYLTTVPAQADPKG